MNKIRLILLFTLIFTSVITFAQVIEVKGVVKDDSGNPIVGANIIVKGTNKGVQTDFDGNYTIKASKGKVLQCSFIGMKTVTKVVSKNVVNFVLKEDIVSLDEIVVVGYGTQKKSDVTGAVASVDFKKLESQPINNVTDALKGRVAGVQIVSNGGSPGGSINVRVRGIGTINNSDPLYVVDGVPVADIDFLNPNDIASIEVLKDASSSAIYGSRGANGVVLLTTKTGKLNVPSKITFSTYSGVKQIINNWETVTGAEWYGIQEELNKTRKNPINLSLVDKSTNTNWFNEISRTAMVSDYNVSLLGGKEDFTYLLGAGYYNEEGTIKGTDFNRITARLKSDYQVKDYLKVGVNLNLQGSERHTILEGSTTTGTINTAIKLEPVTPVWKNKAEGIFDYSKFTDFPNPLAQIHYNNGKNKKFRLLGNVYAELELFKDFKIKSSYSFNRAVTDFYDFIPVYEVNVNQQNLQNKVSRGNTKYTYRTFENTLSYTKNIGKHNFAGLLGFTTEKSHTEWINASKTNIPNEDPALWYLSSGADGDLATGSASIFTLMSYLARVNYSYDGKYLLTASFRSDGSSRFSKGNRWGYFPSVAVGWKISNEPFLQDVSWLSNLKLRVGWGQIGNQNIGVYPYQLTMNGNSQFRYLFGDKEEVSQGYVVTAMSDKNIKWETVESVNIGIDASLFNNRLDFSLDVYNKNTNDMLIRVPIPYLYGYEKGPFSNVGSANNKGIEVSLNWKDNISEDFSYNVGVNVSAYKNKMVSLGNGEPIAGGKYKGGNATMTEEGKPIGYFYGYKTAGVFKNQEDIDNWAVQQGKSNEGLKPGDLKFVDTNGDGKVNDSDRVEIGNPNPDFTFGINAGLSYKNWDLSAFFQGSKGNDIFNGMKAYLYQFDETNKHKDMLHSWTPQNTNTSMPRLNGNDVNNTNRTSDRFVEDGSYLRLKNITLSYDLPKDMLGRIPMNNVKLYLSGQNLFTLTNYSGADPEIGQINSSNYLSRGVDIGTYPQAKTFVMGIKIDF
ncbi:MAG: TonB-dependent receptor [Tenacibaculum sp.]|nr:TonB-dependent receptor [Tenacibaculum sp.]